MDELPEEYELLEFFGIEPIKQDKDVPFYYNILTYDVINSSERIEINISPSYGDIEIFWEQDNALRFNWKMYDIGSLKIDRKGDIDYLVVKFNAENLSDCYIWIKPNFKIIGGMNITH